jgi:tetratricopeptide (TPR) repeat protein
MEKLKSLFLKNSNQNSLWLIDLFRNPFLFYSLSFIFVFIIYGKGLNSGPIGDDYGFIFSSKKLTEAPNPFVFWPYLGDAQYSRSWPLSFSFLWLEFKLLGTTFWAYKLINLIFHFLNFILIQKILKHLKFFHEKIVSFVFLIHPLCVESILWIFQIKTILSVNFFLLSYLIFLKFIEKREKKFYFASLFIFFLSLNCKIVALFMPFIYFFHLKKKDKLLIIPFLVLSLYTGHVSMRAVMTWGKDDFQRAQNLHQSFLSSSVTTENIPQQPIKSDDIKIIDKTFTYYKDLIVNIDASLSKIGISSYTLLFYLKQALALNNNYLVYPTFHFSQGELFIKLAFSLTLIAGALYFKIYSFIFYLLAYLPISGLFYIPYFKYSQVADHWNYLGLIGILLLFSKILQNILNYLKFKKDFFQFFVATFIILFLSSKTFYYSSSFSNREENFKSNLEVNPESKILQEYLMHLFLERQANNESEFMSLMEKIYANPERSNQESLFFTPDEAPEVFKAKIFYRAGLLPEALKELDAFLRKNPQHNEAQILWAILSRLHRTASK